MIHSIFLIFCCVEVVTCARPTIVNGNGACPATVDAGNNCEFSCDSGFVYNAPHDTTSYLCDTDGVWKQNNLAESTTLPTCTGN